MSSHKRCIYLISLGFTLDFCNTWADCKGGQCPEFPATSYSVVLSFAFPGSRYALLDLRLLLETV